MYHWLYLPPLLQTPLHRMHATYLTLGCIVLMGNYRCNGEYINCSLFYLLCVTSWRVLRVCVRMHLHLHLNLQWCHCARALSPANVLYSFLIPCKCIALCFFLRSCQLSVCTNHQCCCYKGPLLLDVHWGIRGYILHLAGISWLS